MDLPDFIHRTRRRLELPAPTPAPRPERTLGVALKHQDETEWCWASVTAGIAEYHNNARLWRQCELANEIVTPGPGINCCEAGNSDACNRPGNLPRALQLTGNYAGTTGSISFDDVKQQIDNRCPIICNIAWDDGVKHFVVIDGYSTADTDDDYVWIKDPTRSDPIESDPFSHWELRENGYQGGGKWMYTIFTKPAGD